MEIESQVHKVSFGLLGGWICIPRDLDDEDFIAKEAARHMALDFPIELIKDRLYGGFLCDDEDRVHVYVAAGQFTYLGCNDKLDKQDRLKVWTDLIGANPPEHFIGIGPFCSDAPGRG